MKSLLAAIISCVFIMGGGTDRNSDGSIGYTVASIDYQPIEKNDLYISKRTLSRYNEVGFQSNSSSPPIKLLTPLDWAMDPNNDPNWRFQLNAWRMIDPYINEYFKKNDIEHITKGFEFVRDWHDYNLAKDLENKYKWYDMSTGIRAMRIAFFKDLSNRNKIEFSKQDLDIIDELAQRHVIELKDMGITQSNHGLFQLGGVALICRVYAASDYCLNSDEYIEFEINKLLSKQFTSQGVHVENSPEYQGFMIRAMEAIGALHNFYGEQGNLTKMKAVDPWLVFPNGDYARVGDTEDKGTPLSADINVDCLEKLNECFAVGDFSQSGYAIVRDKPSHNPDSMIFVTGMGHSYRHSHADALSFELYEHGKFLFVDAGKYGYFQDEGREYVLSANGHNSISMSNTVLGRRAFKNTGSYIQSIENNGKEFSIVGSAEARGLFRFDRTINYVPGNSIEIIDQVERLTKKASHGKIVSQLLFANDLYPEKIDGGFKVKFDDIWVNGKLDAPNCRLTLVRGQKDPLLGWQSTNRRILTEATAARVTCDEDNPRIKWNVNFSK